MACWPRFQEAEDRLGGQEYKAIYHRFCPSILGIQVFKNNEKNCPERHGGSNATSLYMDSSNSSPGGRGGMWKNDTTIKFSCYSPSTPVKRCTCSQYKELYNKTRREKQQFIKEQHIQVKCMDLGWGLEFKYMIQL